MGCEHVCHGHPGHAEGLEATREFLLVGHPEPEPDETVRLDGVVDRHGVGIEVAPAPLHIGRAVDSHCTSVADSPGRRRHPTGCAVTVSVGKHGRHEPDEQHHRASRRHPAPRWRRALRRADRRCRHLRSRCRLPPAGPVPGEVVRRPREVRELRRHVADPQVPGHPLRQRPVHVRLPVQAVDRRRRSPRPTRSWRTWARSSRRTTSTATSATATRSPRRSGRATDNLWTVHGTRTDPRAAPAPPSRSPRTSSGCARATTATRRATRPSGRGWTATRAASCTRRPGRPTSTSRGKQVVVIGSGATAATLVPAIAGECAHVTMLQRSPTYFIVAAQRERDRRHAARARHPRGVDARDRPPQDPQGSGRDHPAVVRVARTSPATSSSGSSARNSPRATTSRSTSPRSTGRGSSAWRSSRRRPVRRDPQRARRRWSPTRSRRSTRPASSRSPGEQLDADVIITATGFDLSVLGDIAFTVDGEPVDFADTSPTAG